MPCHYIHFRLNLQQMYKVVSDWTAKIESESEITSWIFFIFKVKLICINKYLTL